MVLCYFSVPLSRTGRCRAARFPAYKDLVGFDFDSSEVNEAMWTGRLSDEVYAFPG